jgi:tetratricopeptide (TPR) repeat protein
MHSRFHKVSVFVMPLMLIMLAGIPLMAQNRIIRGKVTNDKGEPVKDAVIKILGTDVKREYSTKTDKKGEYFYMGIPYGQYRVVVRAQGYLPDYRSNVQPSISEERVVDFALNPGNDHKLDFEMTTEEKQRMEQDRAKAEKQAKASGEVKVAFEAGIALAQQGKHDEAVEQYKKALEKDPEQPYVLANMADSLAKLSKNDEALAAYQKAISLKPDDAAMYTNMGVLLGKMGKLTESQEAFKKAASVNPGAAGQNFYNLGATLVNSGRAAEAAEAFKQAIAADPNFAEAYYQLGICLSGSPTTIPDAIKALEKYVQIGQKADQVEVAKQLIQALSAQSGERVIKEDKKKKP